MSPAAFLIVLVAMVGCSGAHHETVGDNGSVPPSKVLFLGDSITQGYGNTPINGFRKAVKQHCAAQDYSIDFIGDWHDGDFTDSDHDGVAGRTILTCQTTVNNHLGPTHSYNGVDLIYLLIGSNPGGTSGDYAALLSSIATAEPGARIAVCTLPPQLGSEAYVDAWNAAAPALWDTYDAAHPGTPLIRVDMFAAMGGVYDAANYVDGRHPNVTGHALLSAALIAATDSILAGLP